MTIKSIRIPTTETVPAAVVRLCLDLQAIEQTHSAVVARVQQVLGAGWQQRVAAILQHVSDAPRPVVLVAACAADAERMQSRVRPVSDPLADIASEVETTIDAWLNVDTDDQPNAADDIDTTSSAFAVELHARVEILRALAESYLSRMRDLIERGYPTPPSGMRRVEAFASLMMRWTDEVKRLDKVGATALLPVEIGPLQALIDSTTQQRDTLASELQKVSGERDAIDLVVTEQREEIERLRAQIDELQAVKRDPCRTCRNEREQAQRELETAQASVRARDEHMRDLCRALGVDDESLPLSTLVDVAIDRARSLVDVRSLPPIPPRRCVAWGDVTPGSVVLHMPNPMAPVHQHRVLMRWPEPDERGDDGLVVARDGGTRRPLWSWAAGAPGGDGRTEVVVLMTGLSLEQCKGVTAWPLETLAGLMLSQEAASTRTLATVRSTLAGRDAEIERARDALLKLLQASPATEALPLVSYPNVGGDSLVERVGVLLRAAQDKAATIGTDIDTVLRGFAQAVGISVDEGIKGPRLLNTVASALRKVRGNVDALTAELQQAADAAGVKRENLVQRIRELVAVVAVLHGIDPATLGTAAAAARVLSQAPAVTRYAAEARRAWEETSAAETMNTCLLDALATLAHSVGLDKVAAALRPGVDPAVIDTPLTALIDRVARVAERPVSVVQATDDRIVG